jgi:diguanylate cyclase (GGDEF)-like protein
VVGDAPARGAALHARLDAVDDYLVVGCDVDAALAVATEVESAATAIGEAELAVRARLVQADMQFRKGQTEVSTQMVMEVNRWAIEHRRATLLTQSHLLLIRTHCALGDMATVLDHAVCAVDALEPDSPAQLGAFTLRQLGDALMINGSFDAARERYRQAEQIAVAGDEIQILIMILNSAAYAECLADEPERAWTGAERLLGAAAAHGVALQPTEIDTIARAHMMNGRHAEAEHTILAALRDYHASGHENTTYLAEQLLTLAMAQRGGCATDRAQTSLDECRRLSEQHGYAELDVRALQEQAKIHAQNGDFRAAYEAYMAFHAAGEELRSIQREAQARTRQALFETTEARRDADHFREQARRDPLTGLRNRRYVDENLPVLLDRAAALREPLTIAMIDLDHFKRINDTFSHEAGDIVLVTVSGLLSAGIQDRIEGGFVARMGGEEFLAVLPDVTQTDAVRHLDALRLAVRSYDWHPVTGDLPVTISVGVTATNDRRTVGPVPQNALLADADRNLYSAKHGGRDRVVGDPPANPTQRRRYRELPGRLR